MRSSSSAAAAGSDVGSAAKAAKRSGLLRDDGGQPIVDAPPDLDRDVGLDHLQRGRTVREHLDVDAGLVHLLEAQFAEIVQTLDHFGIALDGLIIVGELLVPIVLFDGDDRTFRLLQHARLPPGFSDGRVLATAVQRVTVTCQRL